MLEPTTLTTARKRDDDDAVVADQPAAGAHIVLAHSLRRVLTQDASKLLKLLKVPSVETVTTALHTGREAYCAGLEFLLPHRGVEL